ncbi:MAG: extracellular solute-binding protein [Spirochaetaceae bacterium]|jgi:microcin C transport system substrate-binding protein|nr:extracellular solute-binding protein [Spirochaetaceae bacterium]
MSSFKLKPDTIKKIIVICALLAPQTAFSAPDIQVIKAKHLSLHGEPLYKDNFTHFNYTNPNAPKRGGITLHTTGTYDNFHRYALRGSCASGYEYCYDTLMTSSDDEAGVLYPLIASEIEYAADYSFIIFTINPNAKDNEGQPITAEDAVFSFNIIFEKGVPQFRVYYSDVKASVLPDNRARFDLSGGDKEKMLSVAQFTVFPKRFWEQHDFSEPLITPPIGTGPYRIKDYKMGQYIIWERVKDYWAADLPVNKGRYNFDTIRYDYYRDSNMAFEAFKAGEYDFREENSASNWATGYKGKIFETGAIIRSEPKNEKPADMTGLVFNIQRPIFSDIRIRRALSLFFDFEWINANLFYKQYKRTRSFFQNTKYAASGLPGPDELAILEPIRNVVPAEIFTREYQPPSHEGDGYIRPQAREALRLLSEAGWELKNGKLLNDAGEQFRFEFLIYDSTVERFLIPFRNNLERYGISMYIRTVDQSQYINRLRSRDFDMLNGVSPASPYPSSDLLILWNSRYIDSTWNTPGVSNPAVDYLTDYIASHQEDDALLTAAGHALDRVLTWNNYYIPEWYLDHYRIAYVDKFGIPPIYPKYDTGLNNWWIK